MVIILTIRCQHDKSGVGKKVEKKKEDANINNKQRTTINNFPDFALLVVQRYSSPPPALEYQFQMSVIAYYLQNKRVQSRRILSIDKIIEKSQQAGAHLVKDPINLCHTIRTERHRLYTPLHCPLFLVGDVQSIKLSTCTAVQSEPKGKTDVGHAIVPSYESRAVNLSQKSPYHPQHHKKQINLTLKKGISKGFIFCFSFLFIFPFCYFQKLARMEFKKKNAFLTD